MSSQRAIAPPGYATATPWIISRDPAAAEALRYLETSLDDSMHGMTTGDSGGSAR